jgi:cytoskeletal protein RodZ
MGRGSTAAIGVGAALRRAREIRGASIAEAGRDTRLPPEQLRAMEDEAFEVLGDEVRTRAVLGSYARYLGLDPEKVVGSYARHADDVPDPEPPPGLGRVERALAAARIRDSQGFLLAAALAVIAALAVFGLLSDDRAAPEAAPAPTEVEEAGVSPVRVLELVLRATRPVDVTIVVDGGAADSFEMATRETRAVTASESIDVHVADGAAVRAIVDGEPVRIRAGVGEIWEATFLAVRPAEGGAASPTG